MISFKGSLTINVRSFQEVSEYHWPVQQGLGERKVWYLLFFLLSSPPSPSPQIRLILKLRNCLFSQYRLVIYIHLSYSRARSVPSGRFCFVTQRSPPPKREKRCSLLLSPSPPLTSHRPHTYLNAWNRRDRDTGLGQGIISGETGNRLLCINKYKETKLIYTTYSIKCCGLIQELHDKVGSPNWNLLVWYLVRFFYVLTPPKFMAGTYPHPLPQPFQVFQVSWPKGKLFLVARYKLYQAWPLKYKTCRDANERVPTRQRFK